MHSRRHLEDAMNTMPRRLRPALVRLALGAVPLLLGACGGGTGTSDAGPQRAASGQYAFWPLFPDEPRVQFARALASSEDVASTKSSGLEAIVFGKESNQEEAITKPYGVEMRDGKIYICDIRAPSLTVFDLRKKQTRLVGVSGVNRLTHPVDVAVADDGMIYVADNDRGAVVVFDAGERYSQVFGYQKFKPVAVAVHGARLFACDMTAQSVVIFDRMSGEKLGVIGGPGDGDGQFRVPIGVETDAAGNIYVVDTMQCRVQKFSADGKFVSAMGQLGDYAGSFARPKQIAIDSEGIQYVVDAAFQNVQMFSAKGELLMSFGAAGEFPGAMNLPVGIAVSDDGVELFKDLVHPGFEPQRLIVVTNQFGADKVNVYVLGKLRAGWTAQQIAAAAAPVSSGVGADPERLKLQMQGDAPEPMPEDPDAEDFGPEESGPAPAAAVPSNAPAKRPK
jgi:sugar lactone lactonase YvrE